MSATLAEGFSKSPLLFLPTLLSPWLVFLQVYKFVCKFTAQSSLGGPVGPNWASLLPERVCFWSAAGSQGTPQPGPLSTPSGGLSWSRSSRLSFHGLVSLPGCYHHRDLATGHPAPAGCLLARPAPHHSAPAALAPPSHLSSQPLRPRTPSQSWY